MYVDFPNGAPARVVPSSRRIFLDQGVFDKNRTLSQAMDDRAATNR
jgi:hypothetical protein